MSRFQRILATARCLYTDPNHIRTGQFMSLFTLGGAVGGTLANGMPNYTAYMKKHDCQLGLSVPAYMLAVSAKIGGMTITVRYGWPLLPVLMCYKIGKSLHEVAVGSTYSNYRRMAK
jgi:hypothetical protein